MVVRERVYGDYDLKVEKIRLLKVMDGLYFVIGSVIGALDIVANSVVVAGDLSIGVKPKGVDYSLLEIDIKHDEFLDYDDLITFTATDGNKFYVVVVSYELFKQLETLIQYPEVL